jgi:hypothetical protein
MNPMVVVDYILAAGWALAILGTACLVSLI